MEDDAGGGRGRIRVLQVIARLNTGGPAYSVGLLSGRRMDPQRFETLLVHGRVAAGEESMADFTRAEGARLTYLPSLRQPVRPLDDARALRRLGAIARRFRPHIVHTHTAKAGFLGRAAALLAVRPRAALVHTYHGHVLEGYFGPARTALYREIERTLARRTDCLIGVSAATVDDLVRIGIAPRERFRAIPLGLDLEELTSLDPVPRGSLRVELGVGDDEVLATYVGRLVPIKRLDVLVRGLAEARGAGAEAHLAIVGDGEIRPRLEGLARELGVAASVHFLGYRRDLTRIAQASDLYALSSDSEGTPVSLIEGGAAARPAVATAVGGVGEVVNERTGILVPPRDERAIGVAIARLAADRGLRLALGGEAREFVRERYSLGAFRSTMTELYEGLIEAKSRPDPPW